MTLKKPNIHRFCNELIQWRSSVSCYLIMSFWFESNCDAVLHPFNVSCLSCVNRIANPEQNFHVNPWLFWLIVTMLTFARQISISNIISYYLNGLCSAIRNKRWSSLLGMHHLSTISDHSVQFSLNTIDHLFK